MSDASSQTSPPQRKLFIQMAGAPGSGKSTTAKLLAQALDGIVIDHDVVRSTILEHAISFDRAAKLAYSLGWALAEDFIKQGRSVISDSTCFYTETLERGHALAQQYAHDYRYVECRVSNVEVLDDRLRRRIPLRSQRTGVTCPPPDASGPSYSKDSSVLFKRWMEDSCRPENNVITIDSTRDPVKSLDYILERI